MKSHFLSYIENNHGIFYIVISRSLDFHEFKPESEFVSESEAVAVLELARPPLLILLRMISDRG